MNKVIITLLVALTCQISIAQNIDKVFNKYKTQEGIAVVDLNKDLLNMAFQAQDVKEKSGVIGKIEAITVLNFENKAKPAFENLLKDIKKLESKTFVKILVENNQDTPEKECTFIFVKKDKEIYKEIIILTQDEEDVVALRMKGNFEDKDLGDLQQLSNM